MARRTRVALLGAGFIAEVHLMVLRRLRGVSVVAVCDPIGARAQGLARRFGVEKSFGSVADLVAWGEVDCVHVLAPPDRHGEIVRECLQAGLHVLVEKPLAMASVEAAELGRLAEEHKVSLGVNHNATFLPAVQRLKKVLASGSLGRVEHVSVVHRAPLRQLVAGQFGHFMFRAEANILWEQGVHLFSVVHQVLGKCVRVQVDVGTRKLPTGMRFPDRWMMNIECERGTAQVLMELGCTMAETSCHCYASDGAMRVDLIRGHTQKWRKTRWTEGPDRVWNATAQGVRLRLQGFGAFVDYVRSLLRLGGGEPFLKSMKNSLGAFHDALQRGVLAPCGAGEAVGVLEYCERSAEAAGLSTVVAEPWRAPEPGAARTGEVVITGGTGMLGREVVRQLVAAKKPVTLLVRQPGLLAEEFREVSLRVFAGDALDPAVVSQAVEGASCVLHLATCEGEDPGRMVESMVQGVRVVGEAALAAKARLVFVSSTAAMYLGGRQPVPGNAPSDPRPEARPAYARGKIAAEAEVQRLQRNGLETVVLRPAIVLGNVSHGGVGLWVKDNICMGWGPGRVPLPLVSAADCAAAIVSSLEVSGIGGKTYALAGEVRPSAREFVGELGRRSGRPYRFLGQSLWFLWCVEMLKYGVKVVTRRPGRCKPSWRDLRSRGFLAPLDCQAALRDLGWEPEQDREVLLSRVMDGVR